MIAAQQGGVVARRQLVAARLHEGRDRPPGRRRSAPRRPSAASTPSVTASSASSAGAGRRCSPAAPAPCSATDRAAAAWSVRLVRLRDHRRERRPDRAHPPTSGHPPSLPPFPDRRGRHDARRPADHDAGAHGPRPRGLRPARRQARGGRRPGRAAAARLLRSRASSCDRCAGQPGTAALREVLGRYAAGVDRRAEPAGGDVHRAVRRARDPAAVDERGRRRPGSRLCTGRSSRSSLEADSYRWHRGPSRMSEDRRRDAELTLARIPFVRFTYEQVADQPEYVVRTTLAPARCDLTLHTRVKSLPRQRARRAPP